MTTTEPTAPTYAFSYSSSSSSQSKAASLDPLLAHGLRLRWVEALVCGPGETPSSQRERMERDRVRARERRSKRMTAAAADGVVDGSSREDEEEDRKADELARASISRRAALVKAALDKAVEGNEGLRRFVATYDANAPLLSASFALSSTSLPFPISVDQPLALPSSSSLPLSATPGDDDLSLLSSTLTPQAKAIVVLEAEREMKQLEKDLRELDGLDVRGAAAAGKLSEYEPLVPKLEEEWQRHAKNVEEYEKLEKAVEGLLQRYNDYVDTVSGVFISWNSLLSDADAKVTRLEKAKAEGY